VKYTLQIGVDQIRPISVDLSSSFNPSSNILAIYALPSRLWARALLVKLNDLVQLGDESSVRRSEENHAGKVLARVEFGS
jgi:hypothetical protein